MLQIRELTVEEIRDVYHDRMKQDFPSSERKPLSLILSLIKRGVYQGIGLYEGDDLIAYAFLTPAAAGGWMLVDYYAVRGDQRGQGYGSAFLRLIKERYRYAAGILVEAESVRSAQLPEERSMREKRIRFYRNNGMETADFYCFLFGVEYEILFLPGDGRENALPPKEGLLEIYRKIIPAILHKNNIFLIAREEKQ